MVFSHEKLIGIIDIGSNSVRLVVFEPPYCGNRPIFNEKVQCGLGRDLEKNGKLHKGARQSAMHALAGFHSLSKAFQLDDLIVIGTAALRDAKDGQAFVQEAKKKLGIDITVITGDEEARYAALGVKAAFKTAKGVVGDLGGGSLELAVLNKSGVGERISLPLGVLRTMAHEDAKAFIKKHLDGVPKDILKHKNFYAVGGTWRALAAAFVREQKGSGASVAGLNGFKLETSDMLKFSWQIAAQTPEQLVEKYNLEHKRANMLPTAALIMHSVLKKLKSEKVIFSNSGLRDGVLADMVCKGS
jgi:exopolyphosphatase/guanosine-5'-triphosphate,3'-diphosphate pyrophosphatase